MKKYACLDDQSVVKDIIISASLELAEQVSNHYCVVIPPGSPSVDVGFIYQNGEFINPNAEPVEQDKV